MRQKQFNVEEALDKAVATFWSRGYEAASMQVLQEEMGINRQSLYNTFGSKQNLFLTSLKHYHEHVIVKNFEPLLTAPSPKGAIREYFNQRVKDVDDPNIIDGCLVTNSLTELGLSDKEVKEQTRKTLDYMENVFYQAVQRGQALGEIDASKDAELMATQLLNNAQGLFVISKSGMSRKKLGALSDQFLEILD